MSQFRVEKRRAEAELTLSSGGRLRGWFFLSASSQRHAGPERVADLLNAEIGFFPFETADKGPLNTVLVNRSHVIAVKLLEPTTEAQLDPGYDVATERYVDMLLTNGARVRGSVRVYRPQGRDRLSDYARSPELFRYVESARGTIVVNSAHIVELRETQETLS
jgi:hypothetical protein